MTKLEDAEQRLNAAKKKQIELKTQLAKSETTLNATKADYAERVRSGAEDAELDKMDAEIFNLDRARARIEIRLDQCNRDIEELLTAREVAHREEEDEKNRADEAAAIEEAAVLEKAILAFVAAAEVHWQRVQGIREHYKARGVAQIPFKLSNLERRITAIFRNGSINRAFEQSYVDIFKGNIAAAEFQLNRTAPTGELASGDAGAIEQAEAVN